MTAQQPQREHCGFEDYCRHFCPASQGRDPCKGTVKQIFCEHDTRSRPHTPAPDNEKLIKVAKLRIRQLFLDDSKCELCEKVTEEDGYDGQNEGCEKGLCIECAIHKALVEFFDAIARTATLAATELLFEQFREYTNGEYTFGDDRLADWWIEKLGYLRTDEGMESLRNKKGE